MAFKSTAIDVLKDILKTDFSRPNMYAVEVRPPNEVKGLGWNEELVTHMIKSVTLPTITVNPIEIKRGTGRIMIPGDPTWGDLTMTVYDDLGGEIRKFFTNWIKLAVDYESGERVEEADAKLLTGNVTLIIHQLGRLPHTDYGHEKGSSYYFIDAWPTSIDQVEFSSETEDSLVEYTISWAYSSFNTELSEITG